MFDSDKLGQSFPPFTIEVERGKVHELALAIGDTNPIYHSREAAQAGGYVDVPLYPTSPTTFTFWGNTQMMAQLTSLGIDMKRALHGSEEFEYTTPIAPGDILTGVMTVAEARTTREQRGSSIDIITLDIRYTNQHDNLALRVREAVIVRS